MNIEAIRQHAQNKGDRKLLKLIEGESANREGVIDIHDRDSLAGLLRKHKDLMGAYDLAGEILKHKSLKTAKPSPAMSAISEQGELLKEIGHNLRTQDNRCTHLPMFCVQVQEKISPILRDYADDTEWINMESGDYEQVPANTEGAEEFGYKLIWKTVAVFFTEAGAKEHLELNGHNYRHYKDHRIYAESFFRNPEMEAVRDYLISLAPPQQQNATTGEGRE